MSTSWILVVGLLVCFAGVGNSLKCYDYACSTSTGIPGIPKPTCVPPRPITCTRAPGDSTGPFRCITQRFARKTKVGENVLTVNQEIRNCSSFLPCALADATCKAANITGKLTKCEIGCCQKDLCNSGGPIPTKGPTRPSGSDLSCYSCQSNLNISGSSVAKADCKNPAKQTCGAALIPGMQQDRCVRVKMTAGGVEQEMRNCSGAYLCNIKDLVCNNFNKTGKLSSCDVSCCFGNLCNTDSTGNTLTSAMTCLLVVIGKVLLGDING